MLYRVVQVSVVRCVVQGCTGQCGALCCTGQCGALCVQSYTGQCDALCVQSCTGQCDALCVQSCTGQCDTLCCTGLYRSVWCAVCAGQLAVSVPHSQPSHAAHHQRGDAAVSTTLRH